MEDTVAFVPCCVPGCTRRRGSAAWEKRYGHPPDPGSQFICQKHWQDVPQVMRRVYARVQRRERRFGCSLPAGRRLWARLRREVGAR